jgi:DNA-binding HxlR family transcriptional regulator
MRKSTSTNTANKLNLERDCNMAYTMTVLGGRWKASILAFLLTKTLRYSELRKLLPGISERMLTTQLKELESHGLINRKVFPEVPPKVEYSLTEKGYSLESILLQMNKWGALNRQTVSNS